MTREELIEVMADAIDLAVDVRGDAGKAATAALSALEAAGVRLVPVGEARAQLIDNDERTTVRIFTPYAPPSPGEITGMRKAEVPCSDCIDGWCQMNCGPRVG